MSRDNFLKKFSDRWTVMSIAGPPQTLGGTPANRPSFYGPGIVFHGRRILISIASVSCLFFLGCGKTLSSGQKLKDPQEAKASNEPLGWLRYEPARVDPVAANSLPAVLRRDPERAKIAQGFGVGSPEIFDTGVYGKIGTSTVFISSVNAISDYDRLYWPMVQVLSKKYGCFIKNKWTSQNKVKFQCRDNRLVVLERSISGGFAKFSGRQFDLLGHEIFVKPRSVARRP
jgi:hypothetical protein